MPLTPLNILVITPPIEFATWDIPLNTFLKVLPIAFIIGGKLFPKALIIFSIPLFISRIINIIEGAVVDINFPAASNIVGIVSFITINIALIPATTAKKGTNPSVIAGPRTAIDVIKATITAAIPAIIPITSFTPIPASPRACINPVT